MADEYYSIPDNPQYRDKVRKLQNSDPASADNIFNPLISTLIENTAAVRQQAESAAPTDHTHKKADISDFPPSMTPTAHASSHRSSGGDPITPADIGALPLSGGTITGPIKYNSGTKITTPVAVYDYDANGQGLVIGAGGLTIVGGGEAATNLHTALLSDGLTDGTEQLHLAADTTMSLHTNCNTVGNRVTVTIDTKGKITAPGGFGGGAADTATTATKANTLTTARKIGNASFNGSADITLSAMGAAPTSHAASGTTYGAGSASNYGHVKLSDSTSDTSAASSGVAATPKAVKDAYDLAQKALTAAGAAQEYTEDALKALFGGTLPDKTLANNSPEVIQRAAYLGIGANFWSVGDKIPIVLNGTVGALTFKNETWYAFILGFNHNPGLEGGNGIDFQFGKNSGGTNVAFVDDSYNSSGSTAAFRMNTSNTNTGGWENSYMRTTLCKAFFDAISAEWQKIIVPCTKYSDNTGGGKDDASYVTATEDKIWLLSEFEVQGKRTYANSAEQNYQKQYDYYKNGNSKIKYQHTNTGSACYWWLRSVYAAVTTYFSLDNTSGGAGSNNAYISIGFAPGFKVA